jgi:hypothetical protein
MKLPSTELWPMNGLSKYRNEHQRDQRHRGADEGRLAYPGGPGFAYDDGTFPIFMVPEGKSIS